MQPMVLIWKMGKIQSLKSMFFVVIKQELKYKKNVICSADVISA